MVHVTGPVDLRVGFTYDVFGYRVEKSVDEDGDGTGFEPEVMRFVHDAWNPNKPAPLGNENAAVLFDLDEAGSLITRYVSTDVVDQYFARLDYEPTGIAAHWHLPDHLGSVRDVVDASGTLEGTITYDGFGSIIVDNGARGRLGYTSRETDLIIGLQYNNARYYDAELTRWITQDPLGFTAGDSNLYRYVHNMPTMATDPSGLFLVVPTGEKETWINSINSRYGVSAVSVDLPSGGWFSTSLSGIEVGPADQERLRRTYAAATDENERIFLWSLIAGPGYNVEARWSTGWNLSAASLTDQQMHELGQQRARLNDGANYSPNALVEAPSPVGTFVGSVVGDVVGGVTGLVTGEAGAAIGERAVAMIENETGHGFTGSASEWGSAAFYIGSQVIGTQGIAEGLEGFDPATLQQLSGEERIARAASGVAAYTGSATLGVGLLRTVGPTAVRQGVGTSSGLFSRALSPITSRLQPLTSPIANAISRVTSPIGNAIARVTPTSVQTFLGWAWQELNRPRGWNITAADLDAFQRAFPGSVAATPTRARLLEDLANAQEHHTRATAELGRLRRIRIEQGETPYLRERIPFFERQVQRFSDEMERRERLLHPDQ